MLSLLFDQVIVSAYRGVSNDVIPSFSAMSRRLELLIFPGFQLLDAAGPIAAFEVATRYCPAAYSMRIVAAAPGVVPSSSQVGMSAVAFGRTRSIDTLLIAGGDGTRAAMHCARTLRFVRSCGLRARRVASVCSGTYLLAEAHLLDGRRATTHWSRAADLAAKFPKVMVEPDRIFVKDGSIWSSAGITAGIDLALALIAEDLGESIARLTAKQLVVYYRRPGGQSQFSELLELAPAGGRFASLLDYIRTHLHEPQSVEQLARRAAMSPRHFARAFRAETGVTPAKAVERLRAEVARAALESGARSVQAVAQECGFGDPERLRRSLVRLYGAPPSAWKRSTAERLTTR
jgi:transcriptional regulator GlxA family with amidase domain